jgi:CheY-like chemotaxis protein
MVPTKSDLRSIHAQAAVVRTLVEEMRRDPAAGDDESRLHAQAMEESARLVSQIRELSQRASDRASSSPPESPTSWRDPVRRRPRVLVVEDDDATREALVRWLAVEYDVVVARDGYEGLRQALAQTPDVILADVWMPRMDGIQMARRILESAGPGAAPVIFLTGQGEPETVAAAISAGGVGYLIKPVDLGLLDDELRTTLRAQSSRSAQSP